MDRHVPSSWPTSMIEIVHFSDLVKTTNHVDRISFNSMILENIYVKINRLNEL